MSTRTESEQRLIEEVHRVCGAPLGDFLLAGLGDDGAVRRRAYVVTARAGRQSIGRRYVEVRGDGEDDLPRGREPLVWAVVLCALFEGLRGGYVVGRHHRQVLEELGWANTPGERALVEVALDKYQCLTFVEVMTRRQPLSPGGELFYVTRQHPVAEYQSTTSAAADVALGVDASFRLEFNQSFSTGILSGGLFGTQWLELRETEPVAWATSVAASASVIEQIFGETIEW